ncbi:hypothetical protein EDC01DRAFT_750238 [Geopyxis carbonaria]|nr:hypothetical protein EDC01DRAFT_750238 [Geopyxis carbonaria]
MSAELKGPCTEFPCPGLRPVQRLITTHNAAGEAVFHTVDTGDHHRVMQGGIAAANILYSTIDTPVDLTDEVDVKAAAAAEPPLHIHNGSVARMVDFAPGVESPLHRALSIDYGVMIEGEMELRLDSGETRIMKPGDVSVNRGGAHVWRNVSDTKPARMIFILLDIKPLIVNGKPLEQFLGALESDYVGRE